MADLLTMELKSCNSDWDLKPSAWTQTWSKPRLRLLIEITYLVSGLNETQVLDVLLQKEFSERQSNRWKVNLFREKQTPQTECGLSQRMSLTTSKMWHD